MNHYPLRSSAIRAALRLLVLGGALVLLAGSIWWDNAANRGISSPPAEPIPFTDVPQGGVNTYNLHAEVIFRPDGSIDPANKVKRTFEMIAAAGFHWVRVQFPWEDIEVCGKGRFTDCRGASAGADTWAKYDYITAEAQRNGLELIVRLDTPPDWARQQAINSPEVQAAKAAGRYPLTGPPDDYNDYGDFVAAVAARYRDRARFFQIWNEPNLPGEWNYQAQDPAQLVRLLRIARDRIKAVNPDAVIVFPALSPTDGRGDGVNDLEYLQGVYDAGGRDAFDIMSAQLYGLGQPPTEHRYIRPGSSLLQPIDTKADVGRVVLLHEIMARNGDDRKAVWVSELGWNSAPDSVPEPARSTWGTPVSEAVKGDYLVQAMQRARREWPWMGPLNIWMFRWGGEPPAPDNPTPYFQLVDFAFNPLPAYERVAAYLRDPTPIAPAQRNVFATAATAISSGLVIAAAIWLFAALGALISAAAQQRAARPGPLARLRAAGFVQRDRWMLALLGAALLLFYAGSPQLPITALGAALFLGLALLRPDLALLYVPLTVPLYLAPKGVWDQRFGLSRPEGYFVPLHEFVLLCTIAGTALRAAAEPLPRLSLHNVQERLWTWLPALLFLLAGSIGVVIADARGPALREWRWLIVEPLLFYALLRWYARDPRRRRQIIAAWLGAGVGVAVIGLLQVIGLDLTALLPRSNCFSQRVVLAEGGLQRISSVYCHPNNLGLALGRVWPVLAALGLALPRSAPPVYRRTALGGALICLAALAASFSKGAFVGAFVALVVLGGLLRRRGNRAGTLLLGLAAGVIGVLALGLALGIERLNPFGGSSSARVELWTSALRMIRDYPLTGVGLDQFLQYRTAPQFGDRYIAPAARATTEQFAAHPHNLVLDLLVRAGPLGLLAMTWLVIRLIRQSRRAQRAAPDAALPIGLLAAIAAALTHGLVDNWYFVPDLAFGFWLMLALADVEAPSARPGSPRMGSGGDERKPVSRAARRGAGASAPTTPALPGDRGDPAAPPAQ